MTVVAAQAAVFSGVFVPAAAAALAAPTVAAYLAVAASVPSMAASLAVPSDIAASSLEMHPFWLGHLAEEEGQETFSPPKNLRLFIAATWGSGRTLSPLLLLRVLLVWMLLELLVLVPDSSRDTSLTNVSLYHRPCFGDDNLPQ